MPLRVYIIFRRRGVAWGLVKYSFHIGKRLGFKGKFVGFQNRSFGPEILIEILAEIQ